MMKTSVEMKTTLHVELTAEDVANAVVEYVKRNTPKPRLGGKRTGLLRMDNVTIKAFTLSSDALDLNGISDFDHFSFSCEIKR